MLPSNGLRRLEIEPQLRLGAWSRWRGSRRRRIAPPVELLPTVGERRLHGTLLARGPRRAGGLSWRATEWWVRATEKLLVAVAQFAAMFIPYEIYV